MKKKERIYISGAITGTKDYMARFSMAHIKLARQGYSVVNPAMVNAMLPEDTTYDEYMAMSFAMLDMCDSIYMLDNWEQSKGACMEFERAVNNGLEIIYQTMPEWQKRIYNTFVASY
jgi:hypothetical protein